MFSYPGSVHERIHGSGDTFDVDVAPLIPGVGLRISRIGRGLHAVRRFGPLSVEPGAAGIGSLELRARSCDFHATGLHGCAGNHHGLERGSTRALRTILSPRESGNRRRRNTDRAFGPTLPGPALPDAAGIAQGG
jgi:hypothetical protein